MQALGRPSWLCSQPGAGPQHHGTALTKEAQLQEEVKGVEGCTAHGWAFRGMWGRPEVTDSGAAGVTVAVKDAGEGRTGCRAPQVQWHPSWIPAASWLLLTVVGEIHGLVLDGMNADLPQH